MPRIAIASIGVAVVLGGSLTAGSSAAISGLAQEPRPITGQVIDGSTGEAIDGATVEIVTNLRQPPGRSDVRTLWLSTATGRFRIQDGPPGPFVLLARKAGYIGGYFGQLSATGPHPDRAFFPGDSTSEVVLRLWRTASVAGTVLDDANEPAIGLTVRAFRLSFSGGHPSLLPSGTARTDDRGQYRIRGLVPGSYRIAVPSVPGRNRTTGHPTTFYPGVFLASQSPAVTCTAGSESPSIDIRLTSRDLVTVSGSLAGNIPDGPPLSSLKMRLLPFGTSDPGDDIELTQTSVTDDGAFLFSGVPAGRYVLRVVGFPVPKEESPALQTSFGAFSIDAAAASRALPAVSKLPTVWAEVDVMAGPGDTKGVVVLLQRGARISGQVVFEPATEKPLVEETNRLPVFVFPATANHDGQWQVSRVEGDGRFVSAGLPPGRYSVSFRSLFGLGDGWNLKSVSASGRDVTGSYLDLGAADIGDVVIILTKGQTELTGVTKDTKGLPQPNATVHVFPHDRRLWIDSGPVPIRFSQRLSDRNGQFRFTGLPPGDYDIVALPRDPDTAIWFDPAYLADLQAFAVTLRLGIGQHATQDVKTVGTPRLLR